MSDTSKRAVDFGNQIVLEFTSHHPEVQNPDVLTAVARLAGSLGAALALHEHLTQKVKEMISSHNEMVGVVSDYRARVASLEDLVSLSVIPKKKRDPFDGLH